MASVSQVQRQRFLIPIASTGCEWPVVRARKRPLQRCFFCNWKEKKTDGLLIWDYFTWTRQPNQMARWHRTSTVYFTHITSPSTCFRTQHWPPSLRCNDRGGRQKCIWHTSLKQGPYNGPEMQNNLCSMGDIQVFISHQSQSITH